LLAGAEHLGGHGHHGHPNHRLVGP
jgi:hypothetical protein